MMVIRMSRFKKIAVLAVGMVFFSTAAIAFLHKVEIKIWEEMQKLKDEELVDYCTEATIELIASRIFHWTSGFTPKEYDAFKNLIRVYFDCKKLSQQRGLTLPEVEDWMR